MLKNKMDEFKLQIWYYKKASKRQWVIDFLLILFCVFIIVKKMNAINLIFIYFFMYFFMYNNMINLSNYILSCTPLKVKTILYGNSLVIWIKSTCIVLLSILISILYDHCILLEKEFFIDILKYIIIVYPLLKILCSVGYYISKKYRMLLIYMIIFIFSLFCFWCCKFDLLCNLISLIVLLLLTLIVSNVLVKKLSYEIIFLKEEA